MVDDGCKLEELAWLLVGTPTGRSANGTPAIVWPVALALSASDTVPVVPVLFGVVL
jgi:hypothetical protein